MRAPQEFLEKNFNSLPKDDHFSLIKRYGKSFEQLSGKEINNEVMLKITGFTIYLKKITTMLTNYK